MICFDNKLVSLIYYTALYWPRTKSHKVPFLPIAMEYRNLTHKTSLIQYINSKFIGYDGYR